MLERELILQAFQRLSELLLGHNEERTIVMIGGAAIEFLGLHQFS